MKKFFSPPSGVRLLATVAIFAALQILLVGCATSHEHRRVAVLEFENTLTEPQYAQLSQSLAELMTASLANDGNIAVIERREMESAVAHKSMMDFLSGNSKSLRRLGKKVGADYLVVGSVAKLQDNFVVNARLFSTATGDIVPGSSQSKACRREEDLYPCVESLARFLGYQAGNYEERVRLANAGKPAAAAATEPPPAQIEAPNDPNTMKR